MRHLKARLKNLDIDFLLKFLFSEANDDSNIAIKSDEVTIDLFLNDLPENLIKALKDCTIIDLSVSKNTTENVEEKEKQQEANQTEEGKQEVDETKGGQQKSDSSVEKGKNTVTTTEQKAKRQKYTVEAVDIPELKELAKKATSYENFASLVSDWMEVKNNKQFVVALLIASSEVESVMWPNLEEALERKNISYTTYNKVSLGKIVANKFGGSIKILQFLQAVSKYKDYPFVGEQKGKMECMRDVKDFDGIIERAKTKPSVEEKVQYVLYSIGIESLSEELRNWILKLTTNVVKMKNSNLEECFNKTDIPEETQSTVKLSLSKLINDYAHKNGSSELIKMATFLLDLRGAIT